MKRLFFFGIVLLYLFVAQGSVWALDCSKKPGSLPSPLSKVGKPNPAIPIEHIVVIMQENHSFDAYFGRLNQPQYYGSEVDGVIEGMTNFDENGEEARVYHEKNLCIPDTDHMWNAVHQAWNDGKNDGFVKVNGKRVMAYYDQNEMPFYYELANQFAIADRYFCSTLSSTYPNRYFLYTGTAFGHYTNDEPLNDNQFDQKTIFEVLTANGISWKYYFEDKGYLELFGPMWSRSKNHGAPVTEFQRDLDRGTLPQVVFIDSEFDKEDEHPNANVQLGQQWVARLIHALMKSSSWKSSALFLTYDENGAFYDHVAPPEACEPDEIIPRFPDWVIPGRFDRLGFRVPLTVVSPYAKHHFVSHKIYDHTSILKFIETKYNLPALTARDANADGMLDMFDFDRPDFEPPRLPTGDVDPQGLCRPELAK